MFNFTLFSSDPQQNEAGYENARYDLLLAVEEGGDPKLAVYDDGVGNPSIGIGFNLDTRTSLVAVLNALGVDTESTNPVEMGYVTEIASIIDSYQGDLAQLQTDLSAVMQDRASNPAVPGDKRSTFAFSDTQEVRETFDTLIFEHEATVNNWLGDIPPSNERAVLVSLAYNGILNESVNLNQAIIDGDRAAAWYEIRYQSNSRGQDPDIRDGIANRRYQESDLFGLYDDPANVSEAEAKNVLSVFTAHKTDIIIPYEAEFDPANANANSQDVYELLRPAEAVLIDQYVTDASITTPIEEGMDQVLVGTEFGDRETLTGSAQNDLIFGESGSDTLEGNAGDDVLYGGTGGDSYYFRPGDGNDTVVDEDRRGLLIYEDQAGGISAPLVGGSRAAGDPANVYTSEVGGKTITYTINGSDLRITISGEPGSITVKNFAVGDLNIRFNTLPTPISNTTTLPNILGDLAYKDFDPDTAGVQTRTDSLGNIINDTPARVLVRADTLYDSTGNNRLEGRAGNDTIDAFRGGNDIIDGGTGSDHLSAGAGIDVVIGGGDSDVSIGGAGTDELYAEQVIDLEDAITEGETQLASGVRGDWLDGGSQVDAAVGGAGNDVLFGGGGADVLVGGGGDDNIDADAQASSIARNWTVIRTVNQLPGDVTEYESTYNGASTSQAADGAGDVVYGGAGDDWINGQLGSDLIDGGADQDVIFGHEGEDHLVGGLGNDDISGDSESDYLDGQGGADRLFGGEANDVLYGGAGMDVLAGDAGDDDIFGHTDDDQLFGDAGSDVLSGDQGNDRLQAGADDDTLSGGDGADLVFGEEGDDVLGGDTGDDRMYGGSGNDGLNGADGIDFVIGEAGDDSLSGGAGNDELQGGEDNDSVSGGEGVDLLFGEAGNDVVSGGAGDDQLQGGENDDTLNGGEGIDFLLGDAGSDELFGDSENDRLQGGAENDFLTGADGNDILLGQEGADELSGGVGQDYLAGGVGDDDYLLDGGGDTLVENLGEGGDTIHTSASYTLLANFENVTLMGGLASNATGNALDNTLDGTQNSAANTLTGLIGNDTYIINASDRVVENASEGVDTVRAAFSYTLAANLENVVLTGDAAVTATGNALNNVLDSSQNAGANLLIGGLGDDTYRIDTGDNIEENIGAGTDTVVSNVSHSLAANVENLTLSGEGNDATGNGLDNVLTGNDGANVLNGAGGADSLVGASGHDTYVVENVGDNVVEQLDGGTDAVSSSVNYQLGQNVENLTLAGNAAIAGTGNDSNNTLDGSLNAAANALAGGAGDDVYRIDASDNIAENANEGSDTVIAAFTYSLGADLENLTLAGTTDADAIGNESDNTLTGNSGNNVLDGGAGADALLGGAGDDTYRIDALDSITESADEGLDTVVTATTYTLGANLENLSLAGTDDIDATGNDLSNTLTGNSGANTLNGAVGADTLVGGTGDDTYRVDNAGDVTQENADEGNDTVQSSATHTLGVNFENLTLTGSAAVNGTGNSLNNILTGNSAANRLTGGTGNDSYTVGAGDTVVESANAGVDTVQTALSYTLGANLENLTLAGGGNANGTGNSLNNVLTGNAGANRLTGDLGNDTYVVGSGDTIVEGAAEGADTVQTGLSYTLSANLEHLTLTGGGNVNGTGNSLNNILTGNSGANRLTGDLGNDTYVVDTGDTVIEVANEGVDTVRTELTYTLGANLENLALTGAANVNGTGNAVDNTLTGNSGNNQLNGALGADMLRGGEGNDTYLVDNAGDAITEDGNEGTDTVRSSITDNLAVNVENLTLTGTAAINGTGNGLDNVLSGNTAVNRLTGGAGDDTYVIGGNDAVVENTGAGIDEIQIGSTYTLGANLEALSLSGTAAANGTGNAANNTLNGNAAANTLSGLAGADTLNGGAGNDLLQGGTGDDTYQFTAGWGADTIVENDATAGNTDEVVFGSDISPDDLVLSRGGDDLQISRVNSTDVLTLEDWYLSDARQVEEIQTSEGSLLLNTQVDQLIQSMANFTAETGLSWEQGLSERPDDVQAILAGAWQPAAAA